MHSVTQAHAAHIFQTRMRASQPDQARLRPVGSCSGDALPNQAWLSWRFKGRGREVGILVFMMRERYLHSASGNLIDALDDCMSLFRCDPSTLCLGCI